MMCGRTPVLDVRPRCFKSGLPTPPVLQVRLAHTPRCTHKIAAMASLKTKKWACHSHNNTF